ncbi:hypothetical protein SETIT_8G011500v2 [Setaria italica]|uniref:Uncharacterized protein n=1 Tax=Setaria italica TaxID=4555 RepID=A0A368S4Q1_SETIT|nr:hypothetical protein SETIT_8G011500v2 [Setaria italica]
MEGEGYASVSLAALEYIHVHKTARLVEAAVASGAIAGAAGLPRWSASPGFLPLPHPRLARTWGRGDPRPDGGAVRRGIAGGPPRPSTPGAGRSCAAHPSLPQQAQAPRCPSPQRPRPPAPPRPPALRRGRPRISRGECGARDRRSGRGRSGRGAVGD